MSDKIISHYSSQKNIESSLENKSLVHDLQNLSKLIAVSFQAIKNYVINHNDG